MKISSSAVFSALITIALFVVIPQVLIRLLPSSVLTQFEASGLDLQSFVIQSSILGIVIAAITLSKGIVKKTSITYLILDVVANTVALAFLLIVVGIGNVGNLGLTSFNIKQENASVNIILNLQIFIWITIGLVTLRVINSIVEFGEARAETGKMMDKIPKF